MTPRTTARRTTARSVPLRLAALLAAALLAAVAGVSTLGALTAPAQAGGAAQIYRYWAYFHVEGEEYVASDVGLADFVPEDGTVEALRYAAPADFNAPNLPRADLGEVTFDAVCADTEAEEGQKRVAVVVDYGVEDDSEGAEVPEPTASCAAVPESANALQTVGAVAEVRTGDGGLLCAVGGYPASGCGGVVDSATPADDGAVDFTVTGLDQGEARDTEDFPGDQSLESAEEDPTDTWLYFLVPAVVLALVLGGVVMSRRRSTQRDAG